MCCADVKDFFLSGTADQLSTDVSSLFEGATRAIIREAAFSVMDHQHVFLWHKKTRLLVAQED